jgi:Predicted double-stranded RNA/RNA-DNA hybrid binding protein
MKYYAVKKGRQEGIYTSWEECQKQVNGFPSAIYKSFTSLEDAENYLTSNHVKETSDADCVAYVDGSYDHSILAYGSGVVLFYQHQKYTFSQMNNDPNLVEMRNVAGEIEAAMLAIDFALKHHCQHLEICYDYAGIEHWCLGTWKANKVGTQAYQRYCQKAMTSLKISFKKIKSHSNHALNDEADELAKKALGLI